MTTGRGRRRSRTPRHRSERHHDHVRVNRLLWERQSAEYDARHRRVLGGKLARAWGLWRIPEASLHLLGATRGQRILELGCGAGRWAVALGRQGIRVVGLDLSRAQLAKARRVARRARQRVRWIRADAEQLPLRDAAFDAVFSDWGALTFSDPYWTIPEIARVLRPGGRLVFVTSSPFRAVAQPRRNDRLPYRLRYRYFGLGAIRYPGEVNFVLTYGDWIALFRSQGLFVESLCETPAPARRRSTYLTEAEERWGRKWPLETIWAVTKRTSDRVGAISSRHSRYRAA